MTSKSGNECNAAWSLRPRLWRVIRTDHPDRLGSASQIVRARTRFGAGLIASAGYYRRHGWTVTVEAVDG